MGRAKALRYIALRYIARYIAVVRALVSVSNIG